MKVQEVIFVLQYTCFRAVFNRESEVIILGNIGNALNQSKRETKRCRWHQDGVVVYNSLVAEIVVHLYYNAGELDPNATYFRHN